ncbi:MAG: hypothetical protein Q8920_16375, partial [Bacillota bacterium]|nr:hypothetical protein [Bacillota bacterium]
MKGKEIRDAVNRIQVHPSVKSKVMELSKNKTKHWIKNGVLKPVAFVAVFSFVCIFGSKLPFLHTSPMHNNSQTASLFDGFIIKTYAEGGEEVALSSKEAIPLKEYSPLMSSVPGIPFRLDS